MDIIFDNIECEECGNTEDVLIEFNEGIIIWLCKKCLLKAIQYIEFDEKRKEEKEK